MTEVARLFDVSRSSLFRWRQQQEATGTLSPGRSPGRPRTIASAQEAQLVAQVAAAPDATLAEHCTQWAASPGVTVSPTTMGRALARLDLPLKKRL
jgi:transposase